MLFSHSHFPEYMYIIIIKVDILFSTLVTSSIYITLNTPNKYISVLKAKVLYIYLFILKNFSWVVISKTIQKQKQQRRQTKAPLAFTKMISSITVKFLINILFYECMSQAICATAIFSQIPCSLISGMRRMSYLSISRGV